MARPRYRIVRRRRRHRLRLGRLLLWGVLLAAAYGALQLWRSPLLRLQQIHVVGGPQSVAGLTGLRRGTLLWQLNLRQAGATLLRRAPQIASVRIALHYPHSASVYVRYRHAVAAVGGPDGGFYGVDPTGRVLTSIGGPGSLPVLTGVPVADVGAYRDLGKGAVQAVQLAASLSAAHFAVSQVAVGQPPVVYLPSGTQVLWPASSNLRATLSELSAILQKVAAQGAVAASVDLRLPSDPVVVLRR